MNPPALASEIPFGVRCVSQVDSKRSVVAEATITAEAVTDIEFEIEPTLVRRRWSSRHVVDIENRGNAPAFLRPVIVDPHHDRSFAMSPSQLQIPAGGKDTVLVKARARHPRPFSKPSSGTFGVSFGAPAGSADSGRRGEGNRRDIDFVRLPVLPPKLTALVIFIAVLAAVVGGSPLTFGDQINHWS
jgi:hypothetical protein